jgi:ATP-binding cassette subfamily F protein 3
MGPLKGAFLVIGVVDLQKHFGGHTVLDGISFTVVPGERVALVGANGCGKTTLLRILAGLEVPDGGRVVLGPHDSMGYLGQEGQLTPGRTLHQEMRQVFSQVEDLEGRLREIEQRMGQAGGAGLERLMEEYATVQARYDHADPATIDARISKVVGGLGFSQEDLQKPCHLFSGGWQMRGAMARVLLQAPDCLLLDEPTNHLDLEAMEWLEEYLTSYRGAVLMVSHDRTFLDKVSGRTLELRNGDLEEYAGNYSFYLEEAQRRYELRLQRYKNQQKKLEQERRFIERFRYKATLSSRVKSREKMLAKRKMEELPEAKRKSMRMGFQGAESSGFEVLSVKGLSKSYGSRTLFRHLGFTVERGDRVALVGANGSGKTTLLRILAGLESADEGRFRYDEFAQVVTFAQHQAEALEGSNTVLEEVESVAPTSVTQTDVRTLLGCFLISGDEVFKKVAVLSGGEKSRVALAKCVLSPSNFLILDEPTNHLDIESRESLQDALDLYDGTILFVTHDRALMSHLANKVLDLSAQTPELFLGSYDEYRAKRRKEAVRRASLERAAPLKKAAPSLPLPLSPARPAATSQGKPDKARRTPWKLEALEKKIFSLEERLEELARELSDPELYTRPNEQQRIGSEYEQAKRECEELTALWEEMTEAV